MFQVPFSHFACLTSFLLKLYEVHDDDNDGDDKFHFLMR